MGKKRKPSERRYWLLTKCELSMYGGRMYLHYTKAAAVEDAEGCNECRIERVRVIKEPK